MRVDRHRLIGRKKSVLVMVMGRHHRTSCVCELGQFNGPAGCGRAMERGCDMGGKLLMIDGDLVICLECVGCRKVELGVGNMEKNEKLKLNVKKG